MRLQLDFQYVGLALLQLGQPKRLSTNGRFTFFCHLCGAGKKKPTANVYRPSGKNYLWFHCFRCGTSLSISQFLKTVDASLASQYRTDTRASWLDETACVERPPAPASTYEPIKPTILKSLPSIKELADDHPAKIYIERRQIPSKHHKWIFFTDDFGASAQAIRPDGVYDALPHEPRIVIPIFDEGFLLTAIQGRSLEKHAAVRYITAKIHADAPRTYGWHRKIDPTQTVYVVEGPFDSMFLPNCLAAVGGDMPRDLNKDKAVIIYDNEPRERNTINKMIRAAKEGWRVCVWQPEALEGLKDINEMVLAGYTPEQVKEIIDAYTYTGHLKVLSAMRPWRRIWSG